MDRLVTGYAIRPALEHRNGCGRLNAGSAKRTPDIFSFGTSFKLAIEPTSPYIYGITDQTLGVSG